MSSFNRRDEDGGPGGDGLNAMKEIKDLKNEIARLTESMAGFASFTQSVSG